MVYKNNIPQPGDSPATDSQADILENFTQLNTQFAIDHISLINGVAADEGEHIKVTINDIQADPGLTFPKTSIYTKHIGAGPNRYTNLYYEADPENAVLASQFPLNAIKAWCRFDGTAASPIAPTDGFNVTNITHAGNGSYTINFTNNLQNANYAVLMMTSTNTSNQISSTAVSNAVVRTGSLAQPLIVSVVIIGT